MKAYIKNNKSSTFLIQCELYAGVGTGDEGGNVVGLHSQHVCRTAHRVLMLTVLQQFILYEPTTYYTNKS